MKSTLLTRTWLVVTALATVGLLIGLLGAQIVTARTAAFTAQATLAALPGPEITAAETPAFWEVLDAGQVTRSAAIVLADDRWLGGAALAAGVRKSTLTLTAGAIPQTTLITVTMKADSPGAANAALGSVLNDALGLAATVSGPFKLQIVTGPRVQSLEPNHIQLFGALGIAGLLVGAGAGLFISRSARTRLTPSPGEGKESLHPCPEALETTADMPMLYRVQQQSAARPIR